MDDTVRELAWEHLQENMVVDSDMLKDKKTSEVNYTCKY